MILSKTKKESTLSKVNKAIKEDDVGKLKCQSKKAEVQEQRQIHRQEH